MGVKKKNVRSKRFTEKYGFENTEGLDTSDVWRKTRVLLGTDAGRHPRLSKFSAHVTKVKDRRRAEREHVRDTRMFNQRRVVIAHDCHSTLL